MLVIFIAVYVIGFIICLIAMGYWQRAAYDIDDYFTALVWPVFIIYLIRDFYIWFCENMIFLGRRLRNGSSKK